MSRFLLILIVLMTQYTYGIQPIHTESSAITPYAIQLANESVLASTVTASTTHESTPAQMRIESTPHKSDVTEPRVPDRFENFNRNSYRMNATLDKHFIRPATVAYITYTPNLIRTGVQNFFDNLRDFVTLGNDILQFNGIRGVKDTMRICINSTVGILGLIDVAAYAGIHEHINTFGQTLKFYGWTNSSYYMIPLIGPSTVRDTLGMIPDMFFNPTWYIIPVKYVYVSIGLFMANGIDQRSKYLDFDQVLDTSLDPYVTVRDFYMQSSGNTISESRVAQVDINTLIDSDSN